MTKLVVIAVLASIGVTLLLTAVLWRINAPKRGRHGSGDGGGHVSVDGGGAKRAHDNDSSGDSGDGGGDGGGGD